MARVGVKRHAGSRHFDAEHLLGAALKRGRDPLRTRARPQRLGQEQPAHLDFDLRTMSRASRDQRAQPALDLGRVLFRNHAPIEAKGNLIGYHVRVNAPLDQSNIERRRDDTRRGGAYA